jgi:Domain of unknown function (DUF4404)
VPDQLPPSPATVAAVQTHLRTIAQVLHQAQHLGPEAQDLLAELVQELGDALNSATVPSADLAHLTECAAQVVQATQRPREHGMATGARDRLQKAIIGVETQFPTVAAIASKLLDTLADLGI